MREHIRKILEKNWLPADDGLIELIYGMVIDKKTQMEIAGELRYAIPPGRTTKSTNQHVYTASEKLAGLANQEVNE